MNFIAEKRNKNRSRFITRTKFQFGLSHQKVLHSRPWDCKRCCCLRKKNVNVSWMFTFPNLSSSISTWNSFPTEIEVSKMSTVSNGFTKKLHCCFYYTKLLKSFIECLLKFYSVDCKRQRFKITITGSFNFSFFFHNLGV